MGDIRTTYKIFVGNPEGKRSLGISIRRLDASGSGQGVGGGVLRTW